VVINLHPSIVNYISLLKEQYAYNQRFGNKIIEHYCMKCNLINIESGSETGIFRVHWRNVTNVEKRNYFYLCLYISHCWV